MTCFAFVTLAFLLGIWAGCGWSAVEMRKRRARMDELEAIIDKWSHVLDRMEGKT